MSFYNDSVLDTRGPSLYTSIIGGDAPEYFALMPLMMEFSLQEKDASFFRYLAGG